MLGVLATKEARGLAENQNLDLVEISPNADPPVCRIMDLGKFRYEERRKDKQQRKHHHSAAVKEIKFHANVAEHDYEVKVNHVKEFLAKGHKVKVSLRYRGRENAHRELGFQLINKVLTDCEELANVDMRPKLMGPTLMAMLGPKAKPVKS